MRICIPIHDFEPGGVERVGLRLAECWHDMGHEVTVVLGRDRGPTRDQAPKLRYLTRPEPFPTKAWQTPWLIWCLWRYLRANQADAIFCAGNTYTIVCVVMKLIMGERCPPVLVKISNDLVRSDFGWPMGTLYRLWLRIQGRMLDRFVAIAPPMALQAPVALQVSDEKIVTIPNPILHADQLAMKPGPETPRGPPHEGRRFLAVGRLEPQKNYLLMIAAFARIARPEDTLTIAGEGSERPAIEAAIARAGLGGQVTLLGHVAEPAKLIPGSDALALSSHYEGLPGAVVEAFAAGLPVAATDCCASMRWLLGDGAFGALAIPGDVESFAAAMESAAIMAAPVVQMRDFASLFTLEQAAPRYLGEFEALAECRAPSLSRLADPHTADQSDRTAPC